MSFHRAILVALATLFTVGMTSLASAGCCDWGFGGPANYGCGGCGTPVYAAPVSYGYGGGCGGCGGPMAAAVYAVPVAPSPIAVGGFGGGWGGWGGGCGCGYSAAYAVASPLYVINQGPQYSGPGLMVPYGTYSPETAYAPAANYPYVPGYGTGYGYGPGYVPGYGSGYGYGAYHSYYAHRYYRPRYAAYRGPMYGRPMYGRPRYYGPAPRWHRPY
jgi:hypothetical protein